MEHFYNFSFLYYVPSHTSIEPMDGLIENYNNFFNTYQDDWKRIIESRYLTDYNPLSNYNIIEDINRTDTLTGKDTNTKEKNSGVKTETLKKQSIQSKDSGVDTYSYNEDITHITRTGNESNSGGSTDTTDVTAFDGIERGHNKLTNVNNNTLTYNNREDKTVREAHVDTIDRGVTNTTSYVGTEPDTTTVTNSGKDTDTLEKSDTTTIKATNRKNGYIGLSAIDIITKEWTERIEKSLTDEICKQFCNQTFFLYEECDISAIESI